MMDWLNMLLIEFAIFVVMPFWFIVILRKELRKAFDDYDRRYEAKAAAKRAALEGK